MIYHNGQGWFGQRYSSSTVKSGNYILSSFWERLARKLYIIVDAFLKVHKHNYRLVLFKNIFVLVDIDSWLLYILGDFLLDENCLNYRHINDYWIHKILKLFLYTYANETCALEWFSSTIFYVLDWQDLTRKRFFYLEREWSNIFALLKLSNSIVRD